MGITAVQDPTPNGADLTGVQINAQEEDQTQRGKVRVQVINKRGKQVQRWGFTEREKRRGEVNMETSQDQAPRGADMAGWQRSGRHEQQTGEEC